jgi:hypothetical protein
MASVYAQCVRLRDTVQGEHTVVKDPVLQDHHVITFYLGTSQYRPLSYRSPKGAKMMVRQRCGIMGARNGIHQSLYSIFDGKILGKSHPDTKILRDQKRRVARRGSQP